MSTIPERDVYLIPGWGTDCRTFYRIALPGTKVHEVNYILPKSSDSLQEYVKNLIDHYNIKENSILMGCSLGGIMAIEISKQISVEKLVLISSVKTREELPNRVTRWRGFPLDKMPTMGLIRWWVAHFSFLLKKMDTVHQQKFKEMVMNNNDLFLRKSVSWIINWKNEAPPKNFLHLHGDRDMIFPSDNIKNFTNLRRGDHMMLINRTDEINELVQDFLGLGLETFSRSQLALRNGSDREEIWVAYQGVIYDVSESRLWKNGKHYEHWAGQDLTEELDADAPHTREVFQKFKAVGKLA